jgi:coenzyme F420-0:L-glutamate ligase/coenzyme F420-1:gamma-L-glutamate ligase
MTLAVAILMKDPAEAKTRLRPVLGSDARERLALLMFENTLAHFAPPGKPWLIGVVTSSPHIAEITHARGAEVIGEQAGAGINAAAAGAAAWARAKGVSSLLIIHADIPTLLDEEIEALLAARRTYDVVVAASVDGGTNALLVTPPDAIDFCFGRDSAAAHQRAARDSGLKAQRLNLPFLSRDMDTPDDLRARPDLLVRGADATDFQVFAVRDIPEVRAGDDLGELIGDALDRASQTLAEGDIVVIAQKIVSKAEGRMRRIDAFSPSPEALEIAERIGKDARKVEAILSESNKILRAVPTGPDGLLIVRHHDGWICANAGIDESNLGDGNEGMLLLLPEDADGTARTIRYALEKRNGLRQVGVVVTDTFGRPWRQGLVNIAIGLAGVPAIVEWVGRGDAWGRALKATIPAFADEIAAASGLLMEKDTKIPVVVMRGLSWSIDDDTSARHIVRPEGQDLFL